MRDNQIIAQLQQDILRMQGYGVPGAQGLQLGLGAVEKAFPTAAFPTGAIHEFLTDRPEHLAATNGFIATLLGRLMANGGPCVWISTNRTVFPAALQQFNVCPHQILFVDLHDEKQVLWATEEALRHDGLAAVVADARQLDLTISRRLQLAVEKSRVTGLIVRHGRSIAATSCVARWTITPAASGADQSLPGIAFPRWLVTLLKVRNGVPGNWQVEWTTEGYRVLEQHPAREHSDNKQRKIG